LLPALTYFCASIVLRLSLPYYRLLSISV
jgi:hypothetical protein